MGTPVTIGRRQSSSGLAALRGNSGFVIVRIRQAEASLHYFSWARSLSAKLPENRFHSADVYWKASLGLNLPNHALKSQEQNTLLFA